MRSAKNIWAKLQMGKVAGNNLALGPSQLCRVSHSVEPNEHLCAHFYSCQIHLSPVAFCYRRRRGHFPGCGRFADLHRCQIQKEKG